MCTLKIIMWWYNSHVGLSMLVSAAGMTLLSNVHSQAIRWRGLKIWKWRHNLSKRWAERWQNRQELGIKKTNSKVQLAIHTHVVNYLRSYLLIVYLRVNKRFFRKVSICFLANKARLWESSPFVPTILFFLKGDSQEIPVWCGCCSNTNCLVMKFVNISWNEQLSFWKKSRN